MKNLLIIFFLFLCYNVVAQNPSGIPTQFSTGWFRQGWHQSDSGEIIAPRIPNFTPKFAGTTILYQQAGVDSSIHYWTGGRWVKINPTGTDTTSLSNRINLKLNISDTANKWWGIGKRWVDTVYRVNDSTIGFTINDGPQQTFEIKGGATGGGGSGTVTSVGLSLPSAFNVTPSSITTSGTFAVTGAGTTSQFIRGNGTLATTDTGMIPNFYLKVRGLLTGTSPITFNQFTGGIGILNANNSGQKGAASFTSEFSDNGSGLIDLSDLVSAGSCTGCILNINAKGRITGYSDGPAGATNNVNIGSGYRILNSATQEVRTIFAGGGMNIDSVSNTDGLTFSSENISNASLTADGNYTQNWNNKQWYLDSIGGQFLFRMGGVGSTGTRRKDFRINWGGSSFGDNLDGYNIMTTVNKADNSGDSLRLGLISSGTGVLSMGYYDVTNSSNNNFISYSTAGLINISARDSIWIKGATPAVTADSVLGVVFRSAGVSRIVKIPLSAAGGGATLNNIGAGYRWVATSGGNIKTVSNSNTIVWDSTSTANTLTPKVDTSVIATQYDISQSQQNIVDTVNKYLPIDTIYSSSYYVHSASQKGTDSVWVMESDGVNFNFSKIEAGIKVVKAQISIEDDIIVLDSVPFVGADMDNSGNSYTAGVGASPGSNAYVPLLATDLSITSHNDGESGTGIMDVQFKSYRDYAAFGQTNRNPRTIMIGFNDYLKSTSGSATQAMFPYAFRAVIFNHFLDTAVASNDPNVTTTGSWSTFDLSSSYPQKSKYLLSGTGRLSVASTAGDSKTYSFEGENVGVFFLGANGTTQVYGRFKVEIDGNPVDTVDESGIADNQSVFANSSTRTEDLVGAAVVYTGLSNSAHTIKVTLLDNVNTNIDAFGVMSTPLTSQSLVIGSIQKLLSAGYTAMSAGTPKNDAGVDATNTIIQGVVNEFRLLGYRVVFNDVNVYTNPNTDLDVDNIHWNNAGHAAGKTSFRSKIIR